MDEDQKGKRRAYVCEGTCGGQVSEEEYNAGKTTCQTEGCTHYGQPFKKLEDQKEQAQASKGPS